MTKDSDRWALLPPNTNIASPQARAEAKAMEAAGLVQHDLGELRDTQRIFVLDAGTGGIAPAIFFRHGGMPDAHGRRKENLIEIFPGSPHSMTITAQDAQHEPVKGTTTSRIAYFVPSRPEHDAHAAQLYAERDRQHRAQATGDR